jgi:hypothetical protein
MNKYTPECPFCGRSIARPENIKTEFADVLGGRCDCGAWYVCDPTGHNVGEAYAEALALMRGDWDINMLEPDADYRIEDMDYDVKRHARIFSKAFADASGKLIFVSASKEPEVQKPVEEKKVKTKEDGRNVKKKIKAFLEDKDYESITAIALQDKSALSRLISLSYDKEDEISWRAMEAMGKVTHAMMPSRVDAVRDVIRRLLWSMGEESGGIGWSSAELLGEIISASAEEFADIIPIVWSFKEEDMFRAGVVRAMWRIGSAAPEKITFVFEDIEPLFVDKDPNVRAYALLLASLCNDKLFVSSAYDRLKNDESSVMLYRNGDLTATTIAEIAEGICSK